ncbi:MAG: hypothetical protein K0S37_3542 [Microbacterium sp.]|jgi:hypothetical protein|nr:hypothetical protein [Microbacterium sp.]
MVTSSLEQRLLEAIDGFVGTVKVVSSLEEVHATEWDAVITSNPLGTTDFYASWRALRYVPENLKVLAFMSRNADFSDAVIDSTKQNIHGIQSFVEQGKRAVVPDSLRDDWADAARQFLAPVVAERTEQFGVRPVNVTGKSDIPARFVPLLLGPDDLTYAARYERTDRNPVWLLPEDVPELRPWIELVFADWHSLDPATFFGTPEWADDPRWMTPAERTALNEITAERSAFEEATRAHDLKMAALQASFQSKRDEGTANERLLLTGQHLELQAEVRDALRELGFEVEDMDQTWDPREPREDFRIRDASDPSWMVIGDATGTTKGVRAIKLMTTERFVSKYVQEHPGEDVPNFWLLANHFSERAPERRPRDLLRGDELALVESTGNLVLDTVALFHLLLATRDKKVGVDEVRALLRSAAGQFTSQMALDWIEETTQSAQDVGAK